MIQYTISFLVVTRVERVVIAPRLAFCGYAIAEEDRVIRLLTWTPTEIGFAVLSW